MVVATILVLLVLHIALPTLDTGTDIILVYKLYRGAHFCVNRNGSDPYYYCDDPTYFECNKHPAANCSNSNDGNNQTLCGFSRHPKMATTMLTPFLLNYFVCFRTFFRKEKNKIFTFIFALLNIYPQFGMIIEQSFREIIGMIAIFQMPPGSSTSW